MLDYEVEGFLVSLNDVIFSPLIEQRSNLSHFCTCQRDKVGPAYRLTDLMISETCKCA